MFNIILDFIMCIVSFLAGGFTVVYAMKHSLDGHIIVDRSIPEDPPHMFAQFTTSPEEMEEGQIVHLEVHMKNFLPRE